MKKILITGGNSFIARNILEQLSEEYTLVAPNSKELNLLDAPTVLAYLEKQPFDAVVHTATYDAAPKHSAKDPSKVLENNLKMFFNLVRCNKYFGRMLYFGSGAEFGREYWIPKMKEEYFDQHVPADQYGFSKYIMTKYTEANDNIYNLRLFAVFGKYEDWRVRIISNLCCQALYNMPLTILQNRSFDFLHISDLVTIIRWFIENKPKRKVYNICSGTVLDTETIAKKIIQISGKPLKIIIKDQKQGKEYSGDNTLLLKELKNFKFSPINEQIKALYEWYENNSHLIDKEKL